MMSSSATVKRDRRLVLAGLVVVVVAAAGCQALAPRSVSFTAAEIEARLARRMPLRRSIAGLVELELARPVVVLEQATQRLATTFDLSLRLPLLLRDTAGQVTFSGIPRYDAASRSISLVQGAVDRVSVDGLPVALASRLRELATRVAEDQFARGPLYTLEPDQTRFGGMELNPTAVRIEGERLVVDLAPR